MCPIPNGFRDRAIWLYSGLAWAPSSVLPSRPASPLSEACKSVWSLSCTDVDGVIFEHLLQTVPTLSLEQYIPVLATVSTRNISFLSTILRFTVK
jgi:hypothetical protein